MFYIIFIFSIYLKKLNAENNPYFIIIKNSPQYKPGTSIIKMYYPMIDRELFMNHLPLYIFLFSLLLFIIIYAYIKITYPFWNTQPVFHSYDFWRYWTSTPFLIQSKYPVKTKYCNFKNIKTIDYLETTDSQKKEFVDLLQCYYIPDEFALYVFNLENLEHYMTGHSYTSYVSFFCEDYYTTKSISPLILTDDSVIDTVKKPTGCISSRSIEFTISNHPKMTCYFLDFICVKREKQEKHLSRNLIQTHEFRQRSLTLEKANYDSENKPILVSMFKKEGDLCKGIVPLVEYTTKIWKIQNEILQKLPEHFVLIEIGKENIELLMDFVEMSQSKYECFGMAEFTNLRGLIQNRLIIVYCIQRAKDIYSAYFFRDSRTQYENKGALLVLCGSIHNSNSEHMFYMGFLHSIRNILKQMPIFQMLMIENISHNTILYHKYSQTNPYSFGENSAAYYLYNYVVPKQPFSKEKIFIVV